jgi:O-Antigen ligase
MPTLANFVLLALIAQIPFEFRHRLFGLSNLQWTFIAVALLSAPDLLANWKKLVTDRLVQAAGVFVVIQWIAAAIAPEFHANASKAAARFTAGLLLLVIAKVHAERNTASSLARVWVMASAAAAAYALVDYAGFGPHELFRTGEFYIGQIQRLSGSFDYPNSAAAYFAISLPIIWWSGFRPLLRGIAAFLAGCVIILTFSKGALVAAAMVILVGKRKRAVPLLVIGAAAYAALLPLNRYLAERVYGPAMNNPIGVEYKTPWNKLTQQPGINDAIPVQIRNTGVITLRSRGMKPVALASHWWNMATKSFIRDPPVVTSLPFDVQRGDGMKITAAFRTPTEPGRYLLVVEFFTGNFDWFNRTGVWPALIQTDIQPSVARTVDEIDLTAMYHIGETEDTLDASVSRSDLWHAALAMFRKHPFGVGPDNYRLEYGKYLHARRWDTKIYSNSLYLELLTGSGFLGLTAFGLVLFAIPWRPAPSRIALAIFLVHGIVDVFLMTTPIYFAFWLLAGSVDQNQV